MHEHYDADGNLTGYTVVTRESLWDDESRGRALRLAEYKRSLCPCGCGHPVKVAHDPTRVFGVASYTCMAQRAIAVAKRRAQAKHKDEKPNRDHVAWDDGLNYYAVPQGGEGT